MSGEWKGKYQSLHSLLLSAWLLLSVLSLSLSLSLSFLFSCWHLTALSLYTSLIWLLGWGDDDDDDDDNNNNNDNNYNKAEAPSSICSMHLRSAELHHVRLPRPRAELLRRSPFFVQFLCLTLSLQKSKPLGLLWNLLSYHSLNFSSSCSSTFFRQCVWAPESCLRASPFILALGLLGAVSNK